MDTGRARPPDPGGEASNRGEESSIPPGLPPSGSSQTQTPTPLASSPYGPPLSGIIQNPNQPAPSTGASPRQPWTGQQQRASGGSRQPGQTARFGTEGLNAALPREPRGTVEEMRAEMRRRRAEKDAAALAASTSGNKRAVSELESEDRPRKRQATGLPRQPTPVSIPKALGARCIVWYDYGFSGFQPLFGSLNPMPGISIKVNVMSEPTGEILIIPSMGVNKGNTFRPISIYADETSRFKVVWRLGVKTANDTLFQVDRVDCTSLDRNTRALGEARHIIKTESGGRLEGLKVIDMKVNGLQVESPYESQYWQCLQNGTGPQKTVNAGVAFLYSLAQTRCPPIHLKIWFRAPYPPWDETCGSVLKRFIKERNAANDEIPVQKEKASNRAPKPCSGEKGSAHDKIVGPSQVPEDDVCSEEGEIREDEMPDEASGNEEPGSSPWWAPSAPDGPEENPWDNL